jgi:DNA replication and repair protein RecF
VRLERLWLTDFRNYAAAELVPSPDGLTVVTGRNGEGKSNLLEAIGYLATLKSFRGAPPEAMVRVGSSMAIVRASGERDGRTLLIEAELHPAGRDRVLVNRQALRRTRDLLGALQVSVFSPDDLELVKGGPALRRDWLDDVLAALHPRHDQDRVDLERILRQRNALLRQNAGGGRPPIDVLTTLDVWDTKLAATGSKVATARQELLETGGLGRRVAVAYDRVAERAARVTLSYQRSWSGPLGSALAEARDQDLRRGVSTVGPHRDEVAITVEGMPSRTHSSQGEQRSLALALRLGGHAAVTDALASPPVLLLDDVFSELDAGRADALLGSLPAGQAILTTAGTMPAQARPEVVVRVEGGKLLP